MNNRTIYLIKDATPNFLKLRDQPRSGPDQFNLYKANTTLSGCLFICYLIKINPHLNNHAVSFLEILVVVDTARHFTKISKMHYNKKFVRLISNKKINKYLFFRRKINKSPMPKIPFFFLQ